MNTYALPALRDKRARIAGEIDTLQKRIVRLVEDLNSLDQTIGLFDTSYRVGSIRPIKPHRRAHLFRNGELGRIIMSAMRTAKRPMTTPELVLAVCRAIGQGEGSYFLLRNTVAGNLNYLARRGRVAKFGKRRSSRWGLVREIV